MSCEKCAGSGWLWWFELDEYSGPALSTGDDDTRYTCDGCRQQSPEPQEGAPSERSAIAPANPVMADCRNLPGDGVPSCDSELAEIRADDERDGMRVLPQHVRNTYVQHLMTQRRTLLRMVDELTVRSLRDAAYHEEH